MYEAPSEMIDTYLEYRLRDDDSHTVTLWHNPQIPHWGQYTTVSVSGW